MFVRSLKSEGLMIIYSWEKLIIQPCSCSLVLPPDMPTPTPLQPNFGRREKSGRPTNNHSSVLVNYLIDFLKYFVFVRIFVNFQLNSCLWIILIKQTDFYFFWLILLFHETDNHYQLSGISLFLYFWSKICQLNFPTRQNFPQKMDMFI